MTAPVAPAARRPLWRLVEGADLQPDVDLLAVEEPLEIRVNTRSVSVTMRTPGHDEELALGFLVTEGIVGQPEEVERIAPHPRSAAGNVLNVFLRPEVALDWSRLTRHVFASSSCGVCGKATIESVQQQFRPVRARFRVGREIILSLPHRMREAQATFAQTGGLHAAALFSQAGNLLVLREDVGRHNAVDKVIGYALRAGLWPLDRHVLLVSGRASFEIMQKALAARLAFIAAVSAPSSLAVDFAQSSGQTLVGFVRDRRFNVYCHPGRVGGAQEKIRRSPARKDVAHPR